jgi:glycine/D-amino acid oxidase-like deaminating enzyme
MTRYGVPYWLARVPKAKRTTYPRHRGPLYAEVAVVGGGLTGTSIAWLFASSGIRTVVLERDRVGQGATAGEPGIVRLDPAPPFRSLETRHGRRVAHAMWIASRRAANDLLSTLDRLKVRCDLLERDGIDLALSDEQEQDLRREYRARQAAGVEGAWYGSGKVLQHTGIPAAGGIRSAGWALIDPYCACQGLAAAAVERGADFFERSPMTSVRPGRLGVEVRTDAGTVDAKTVIIATNVPPPAFKSLTRHFSRRVAYAALTGPLDAAMRRVLGRREAVVRDSARPPHQITWTRDHRMLALGVDQPASGGRASDRALLRHGGQLMYETSLLYPAISGIQPEYVWDVPIAEASDGLIYAGSHRNYPRHLFALGRGHNGPGAAFLAARILLRQYLREPERDDAVFCFGR